MALGDLNRIESAFAEATLDPALWGRALDIVAHETGSFGATPLSRAGVVIRWIEVADISGIRTPLSRAGVVIPHVPATETVGEALEHYFRDGWYLIERGHAGVPLLLKTRVADDSEQSMQFDMRPSTPSRCKKFRIANVMS
jgi:hypothetical protein